MTTLADGAIDPRAFRDVMGRYPTGVCVVTAQVPSGERLGISVGSFMSVSLDPLLVGFLPNKGSRSWSRIEETGRFCVNVLGAHQIDLCSRFASSDEDKFGDLPHDTSPSGQPVLRDCLAWIDCSVASVTEAGDHWMVLGNVEAMGKAHEGKPLLFFGGKYHQTADIDG